MHEAEHATQWGRGRPGIKHNGDQAHTLNTKLAREIDADFTTAKYLKDMEQEDAMNFLLDMQMSRSFTLGLMLGKKTLSDDIASIIRHRLETGESININLFLEQKADLLDKIEADSEMNVRSVIQDALNRYPELKGRVREMDRSELFNLAPQPQQIIAAVENLLESDENLTPVQIWEAQNYLEAMERLGYESNTGLDYESYLEKKLQDMGFNPSNSETTSDITLPSSARHTPF